MRVFEKFHYFPRLITIILELIAKACEMTSGNVDVLYFLKFPHLILRNLKTLLLKPDSSTSSGFSSHKLRE